MGSAKLHHKASSDSERTPLTSHHSTSEGNDCYYLQKRVVVNQPERVGPLATPHKYSNNHVVYLSETEAESARPRISCSLAVLASIVALALCLQLLLSDLFGFSSHLRAAPIADNAQKNLFDELDRYIFEDYDSMTPFSDFLPGLAGIYGKPLYSFWVNRGQGIASFGIGSKERPIMEYVPSNLAYERTSLVGFRTFIQGRRNGEFVSEPFSALNTRYLHENQKERHPKRTLFSGQNEMQIQEVDTVNHLETNVTYFLLPEEDFGAFVRRTTITNTHKKESITISVLDGLTHIQPFGGENFNSLLKDMSNTLLAWMRVKFPYEDTITMPFYRLTSEPSDSASIKVLEQGHYCLSMVEGRVSAGDENYELLPVVYDTDKVFGEDTTLLRPIQLYSKTIKDIVRSPQYGMGRSSSCFAAVEDITLAPGETLTISSFYGGANAIMDLPVIARRITQPGFVLYKLKRSRELIRQITASVETKTSNGLFDNHVQQMYLDNSLRGGIPVLLGHDEDGNNADSESLKVFHVFSRIHGDLERDYNNFMLSPTFFSEGAVDFRDVAQNRRSDVIFNPRIGSFNVKMFLSFIQADGYEPLSVEAVVFQIKDLNKCNEISTQAVGPADGHRAQREALSSILCNGPFRPGQLFSLMEEQNVELIVSRKIFIDIVSTSAEVIPMAIYKKGFWADHWTYYLDLIETYLSVYPDKEENLLFDTKLKFFFSPAYVQPRAKKYVLSLSFDGLHKHVRQLGSTVEDEEKMMYKTSFISNKTGWYTPHAFWQSESSTGELFECTAIGKLFLLGTIKFATRDAYGMGIEYEAGRPGWNDANNGLPGMIGSGMPETYELKSLLSYTLGAVKKYKQAIIVPSELSALVDEINHNIDKLPSFNNCTTSCPEKVPPELFAYWDRVSTAREVYREQTKVAFSGSTSSLEVQQAEKILTRWIQEIDQGIDRALMIGTHGFEDDGTSGIPPTYFAYNVTKWRQTGELSQEGHPLVEALEMTVVKFPLFLEGPTRMLKNVGAIQAKELYQRVRSSSLRDSELGMYTISASLEDQPFGLGRSVAFPPGYLENGSVWLHMAYKLLLQLLRHGMAEEFYSEIFSGGLVPFMDSRYGRSLRECSSFIVSSRFPDPSMRGRGFLARSSGSTAEFLSMWSLMFIGPRPFFIEESSGELRMQLVPALPASMFQIFDDDEEQIPRVEFKLFSSIRVQYLNHEKKDLFGQSPDRYKIGLRDSSVYYIEGPYIPNELAEKIRRVVFADFIEAHF